MPETTIAGSPLWNFFTRSREPPFFPFLHHIAQTKLATTSLSSICLHPLSKAHRSDNCQNHSPAHRKTPAQAQYPSNATDHGRRIRHMLNQHSSVFWSSPVTIRHSSRLKPRLADSTGEGHLTLETSTATAWNNQTCCNLKPSDLAALQSPPQSLTISWSSKIETHSVGCHWNPSFRP